MPANRNNPASGAPVTGDAPAAGGRKSRLWLWFVAAFLVQLTAWGTWLVIASHHKVQEVPLVRPR